MDSDPAAVEFEIFCREQQRRIVGLLGLYCGDRDLAQDLTQETLVRLCGHWSRVRLTEDPERWVTRVAMNLAKSHLRSRLARRRVLERYGQGMTRRPDDADPASVFAVRAEVVRLPERQRRALVLRYFADLPVADVASVMGCPEGTVKTLTFDAITRLRRAGLDVSDD